MTQLRKARKLLDDMRRALDDMEDEIASAERYRDAADRESEALDDRCAELERAYKEATGEPAPAPGKVRGPTIAADRGLRASREPLAEPQAPR